MGRRVALMGMAVLTAAACGRASAQLDIDLAHDSDAEARTRTALLRLVDEYDVSAWLYTNEVLIDETSIPHSHPVLTLHTRHLHEPNHLLSTFVHEQFHWLEDGETLAAFRAAMADFEELFPDVPDRAGGGASDDPSTYRHLIVCDLELQAMTRLLGEETARTVMASWTHYEWIYDQVLSDPRIRETNARHGFTLEALEAR